MQIHFVCQAVMLEKLFRTASELLVIALALRKPISDSVIDGVKDGESKPGELGRGDCSDSYEITYLN